MSQTLDSLIGSTVHDHQGQKIGKVNEIYLNNETGSPTWVSVSTGLFSSDSLVPLAGAQHEGDALNVAVSKDAVKNAPHLDDGREISAEEERQLFSHYKIDPQKSNWDTYGRHAASQGQPQDHRAADARTGQADERATAGDRATGDRATGDRAASGDRATGERATADRHANDGLTRSEERLNVETERQAAGTARLRKYVVTEKQSVTVPVTREEVRVEREPIREGSATGTTKIGEDTHEVTLHEDRVNVTKESVPVERVRLAVDEVEDKQTVTDTVRKEKIDTEGIHHRDTRDERADQRGNTGESTR
ncbi:DUF2382 domain-containing protein [Skermania sp. ID1734]|uniref:PRC and DUF2382 domain-containing protein n=1 Tax=Skermania sp. ID1734 TaxID=2597516 RepID=UPI00117CA7F1|nr:PRC and DUF2382 domain-containing protein [Skermania sp. ID1734]TSE00094.1 DUF2382 domain-containing protein [Skermania sp. ID1734]